MERYSKQPKRKEFIRQANVAGNEVITTGFPFAITHQRGTAYTKETVAFVFLRRPTKTRNDPNRGLRARHLRMIEILEALGLRVIKL